MSMKTAGHRTMDDHPHQLAEIFRAMANLLAGQRANPYRVRAYRKAADSILAVTGDLADLAARHQLQDLVFSDRGRNSSARRIEVDQLTDFEFWVCQNVSPGFKDH